MSLMPRRSRTIMILTIFTLFLLPVVARAALFALGDAPRSYRDADWSSAGTLPPASQDKNARVLVMTGTAGAWKGVFAVHSWIALKRENADAWTRYDVVGWGSPLRRNNWPVDGRWYGNVPVAIVDLRGDEANRLIPKIEAAVRDYRYREAGDYKVWPGPNSNSFVAAVLRAVPELGVQLPSNAVGRDFRDTFYIGRTDSGTGVEFNLWGYAGIKVGWVEGIEFNLLGLVAGVDVRHPAIKLPGYGRIGLPNTPQTSA
jgi:hypothetical protein